MHRYNKIAKIAISRVQSSQHWQYASRLLCTVRINVSIDRKQTPATITIKHPCNGLGRYNPTPQFPPIGGITAHLPPSMGGLQANPLRLQNSQFDSCSRLSTKRLSHF